MYIYVYPCMYVRYIYIIIHPGFQSGVDYLLRNIFLFQSRPRQKCGCTGLERLEQGGKGSGRKLLCRCFSLREGERERGREGERERREIAVSEVLVT
jgi:hypothetical protein